MNITQHIRHAEVLLAEANRNPGTPDKDLIAASTAHALIASAMCAANADAQVRIRAYEGRKSLILPYASE